MTVSQKNVLSVCLAAISVQAMSQMPPRKSLDPNPWDGSWKLNVQRSSPIGSQPGIPQVYRFKLGPGSASQVPITWEIPELGEIVTGHTDGVPMPVARRKPTPGLTLAVRKDGDWSMLYTVYENGKVSGGGRMMLVDDGTAWVDLTWGEDRQDLASVLVYVRE